MTFSIILVLIGVCLCRAENCGILKHDDWPWSVSIFYGSKSTVLCQGALISSKHVLTAGHCLKDKDVDKFLIYPGMIFYRLPSEESSSNNQITWNVSKVDVHPEIKLTLVNKTINGNTFFTLAAFADIAVATLSNEIELSDAIFPICLPHVKNSTSSLIIGKISGWSLRLKAIINFNSSFTKSKHDEFHEIRPNNMTEFAEGTGFFAEQSNSSWALEGILSTESFNTKSKKIMNFVNVALYSNWIKMILWGAPENLTKVSVDMLKTASTTTEPIKNVTTEKYSTHVNSTVKPIINSLHINTTMKPQRFGVNDIDETANVSNSTSMDSISLHTEPKLTTEAIKNDSELTTTLATLKNQSEIKNKSTTAFKKDVILLTTTATFIPTTSHPTTSQPATSAKPVIEENKKAELLTTFITTQEYSTPATFESSTSISQATTKTTSQATTSAKPIIEEIKKAANELLSTSTTQEYSIPAATFDSSTSIKDLRIAKAFDFNTTAPKISPLPENVIMPKEITNNDTPRNISLNDIAKNSSALISNSTKTEENQALLAQFNFPPWMVIGGAFGISLVVLFLIFCALGQGKPEQHH